MEERQVIENFLRSGSEESFCALFEMACLRVRRYFLLRGLDGMTADDLTQNVFVKIYRGAADLRNADQFRAWMFTIARNEMVSFWRGKRSRIETVDLDALPDNLSDGLVIEPEIMPALRLMDWLKALEPAERDLVVMRFVEGLSYEELAEILKIPLGTVKWRIFNARKKLARGIQNSSPSRDRNRIN